jgi:hypothetical protein
MDESGLLAIFDGTQNQTFGSKRAAWQSLARSARVLLWLVRWSNVSTEQSPGRPGNKRLACRAGRRRGAAASAYIIRDTQIEEIQEQVDAAWLEFAKTQFAFPEMKASPVHE